MEESDEAKAERVRKVLATLPPIQEMVVRMHFGIGHDKMSVDVIAKKLGRTEAEVRALLEAGLAHVRAQGAYIDGDR